MRLTTILCALLVAPSLHAGFVEGWERLSEPVKAFSIRDLSDKSLTGADLRGKIVVVDFWATWCTPCIQEMPQLAELHERWKGRKDVVLLSLNVSDEKSAVEAFMRQSKLSFPVYVGDSIAERYSVEIFPTKLIFDFRNSPTLRFRGEGPVEVSTIEKRVAELLTSSR